jgi:hypothetical protein
LTTQIQAYPQTDLIDPSSKRPSRAWLQYFQNLINFTSAPSATSGGAVLPAKPAGFMNVTVAGKPYKVPYYNV